MNSNKINKQKVFLFIIITFLISWLVAFMLYRSGITYGSPRSLFFIALIYMPAPAYATIIVQKLIYDQPLKNYGLRIKKSSIRWIIGAMGFALLFALLTVLIVWILGNIFGIPGFGILSFDKLEIINYLEQTSQAGVPETEELFPMHPILFFIIGLFGNIILGAIINLPFALGEELGWRGLLVNELAPLGFFRSTILIGIIWGAWHIPVILMGHNFPAYPIIGSLMMVLFCISLSFPLSYFRLRANSVFAPTVMHGILNANAGLVMLYFIRGNILFANISGVAGILAAIILTIFIFKYDPKFISVLSDKHNFQSLLEQEVKDGDTEQRESRRR